MRTIAAALVVASLAGCYTSGFYERRDAARYPVTAVLPSAPFPPRALPMFAGNTGAILTWTDLMAGVFWADVVFVGEMHDDAVGHQVQRAIFVDAMLIDRRTALSMEMLERQDQPALDEYLAGTIDAETFVTRTDSANWGAKGKFVDWYLPIIDEARTRGTPVVAANAPRNIVRMARLEGWDALHALPADQRELFAFPRPMADGGYELRFREYMSGGDETATMTEAELAEQDARLTATFRSQLVWDATMGDSIARTLGPWWSSTAPNRVVHLVGRFHTDFNGGTVQQTRARRTFAKFLTVSLVPERALSLRDEDRGIADVVIYTGWDGREDGVITRDAVAPGASAEETSEPAKR